MKNAEAVKKSLQDERFRKYEELRKQVTEKVEKFTESMDQFCVRFSSWESFAQEFIDPNTAIGMFRELGFEVTYEEPYTVTRGHLWWKHQEEAPGCVTISVPMN